MRRFYFCLALSLAIIVWSCESTPYKVGTTTAIWKTPTVNDFIEARQQGIEYVEVAFNKCYRGVPEHEVIPRIKSLCAQIDSADMEVWSIHLPFSRTLDISVLDDSLRDANVAFMAEMIKQSAQFNPARLVLHPSSEPIPDSIRAQRLMNARKSIAKLKVCADSIGVELCIENLPRTCLGNTPEELLDIIKDIPGVKVCFDTNHYTQGSTEHFMDVLESYIGTIHASDFDFENECHWLPTQGKIDWKRLVTRLKESGYQGIFMYEATKDCENGKKRPTPQRVKATFDEIMNR